jgi:hypothetical protein
MSSGDKVDVKPYDLGDVDTDILEPLQKRDNERYNEDCDDSRCHVATKYNLKELLGSEPSIKIKNNSQQYVYIILSPNSILPYTKNFSKTQTLEKEFKLSEKSIAFSIIPGSPSPKIYYQKNEIKKDNESLNNKFKKSLLSVVNFIGSKLILSDKNAELNEEWYLTIGYESSKVDGYEMLSIDLPIKPNSKITIRNKDFEKSLGNVKTWPRKLAPY